MNYSSLTALILLVVFTSCNSKAERLNAEINALKKSNDSLLKITENIKDKFVFDEASVKVVDLGKGKNKIGEDYHGTFVIIANNKNSEVLFSTEFDKTNFELKNPIKLERNYEGYNFKTKLQNKENEIHFKVNTKSEIGRNLDGLLISDKKIVE